MSEQITVTVKKGNRDCQEDPLRLEVPKGTVLLDVLREGNIALPSLCGMRGKCGRCLVHFTKGAPLPTQVERGLLAPDRLRQGYRLACVAKPVADCVLETAFAEEEKRPVLVRTFQEGRERAAGSRTVIAADIGTTTIAMQLLDADNGYLWDTFTCLNPQRSYGADVISRIHAGCEGKAEEMKNAVRDVLTQGIRQFEICTQKNELCKPEKAVIAANTTMGHLFMGYSVEGLGKSPFTPVTLEKAEDTLCGIKMILLPGISAFIGGDIVSGLYACGLAEPCGVEAQELSGQGTHCQELPFPGENKNGIWLLADLGTNAEMVIGSRGKIIATAAAAGPAFESAACAGNSLGKTAGKTGSGSERIQALSLLLEQGKVDETGLLQEPYFETGITVNGCFMTQKDIRDIQMAKAAVRTGIHFLKEKAGLDSYDEIERVYLAGGLGFYLDRGAAVRTGLLPESLENKIVAAGNTSLAGAGRYARRMAEKENRKIEELLSRTEVFNLAEQPEFEKEYIRFMDFMQNGR